MRRENKEIITITIIVIIKIIIIIEGSRLRASHLIIKLKPFISSAALHSVILKIIPANIKSSFSLLSVGPYDGKTIATIARGTTDPT